MSPEDADTDRRERPRATARHAAALGGVNLNPFGDLHTLQHLSARLARSLRGVFEPLLRHEVRTWAEPLSVQRFVDYRSERSDGLTAWVPLAMTPGSGQALVVIDGKFTLELLDLFFGGTGAAPHDMPAEFSPAGEAMLGRLSMMLTGPLTAAWEPVAHIHFAPGRVDANAATVPSIDGEDPMVVTRFGIAKGNQKPAFIDIVYPVQSLKPYAPSLTGKVLGAAPDPAWRNGLTRAMMTVTFPVRSVLAEPVISLAKLMELKEGDVIPITVAADVPVMVAKGQLGLGTVGTSNGRAAIKLNTLSFNAEDLA
ncbi:flagellar motor switch protein FliM [Sphingomonas sp.]|uniref:flagellar motor switch protein FliM n=1 Tax=Sphingomonas sp. TaxID=28214 RepID=UPI0025D0ECD4|nr:flagellar motor switch protein FliM [Sphingomonas sp.]